MGAPWPLALRCTTIPPPSLLSLCSRPHRPERSLPPVSSPLPRAAGCPTAAPYAPLNPSPPPRPCPPSYSSSGSLDVLTVTDPTLPPPPPHRTRVVRVEEREGEGEPNEGVGNERSRNRRKRDRQREMEGERTVTARTAGRGMRDRGGLDALEEGRWGVRAVRVVEGLWARGFCGRAGGTDGRWVEARERREG